MSSSDSYPVDLPPTGNNPGREEDGTTPGSFAQEPDVGSAVPFSSPDTPGMPEPSDKTAWNFMPDGWTFQGSEDQRQEPNAWEPPADFEPTTQLDHARLGAVTEAMERVAEREDHLSPEEVRREVAAGRMILPANHTHRSGALDPMAIGRASTTKVNANLGASDVTSETEEEVEKMEWAVRWGADTVMDLSTGGPLDDTREAIVGNSPVPVGTVPLYSMIVDQDLNDLDHQTILDQLRHQARQGVDYFTIHAGLLREHLDLVEDRINGIVSRGGSLTAKWMMDTGRENPTYEIFDEICDIMREHDVSFSLGDGLRPGGLSDATDLAQLAELSVLGELTEHAWSRGVQVMVEGPGHVSYDQIEYNMKAQRTICHGAPFYVLGPLVTDSFPGYDHMTSSIGATAAAYHGASMLCYVTPKEHLGLPTREDVKEGCAAYRIAAHSADVALGIPGTREWDDDVSKSRAALNWQRQFDLAYDSDRARAFHDEDLDVDTDFCAMCGHDWCSVRISKEIQDFASGEDEDFQPDEPAQESPGLTQEQIEFLAHRGSEEKVRCHSDNVEDPEEAIEAQEELLEDVDPGS